MISLPAARYVLPVFAALLSLSGAVRAQTSDTLTLDLDALIAEALAENPDLRALRLEAEALATRPDQVTELPDPTVNFGYRPLAIGDLSGAAPAHLSVQQAFPFPGKRRLDREIAERAAEVSALTAEEQALELVYLLRVSYFELWRIQEQDRLIRQFQEQVADFEQSAARQYEVGTGLQQAILKAQLEQNTLARRRLDLVAERRRHLERLARLTHRPALASDHVALADPVAAPERPAADQPLPARPEVQAMEVGMRMADAEIERARRAYLPEIIVGAGLMDMMMPGDVAPLDNLGRRFGLEFGVTVPLRRTGRDAALTEARLRRDRYEALLESVQVRIESEANDLRHRLALEREAVALYRDVLRPQAEITLEATLSAYTTGRTGFLDLLDAQRMLFDLAMTEVDAHADLLRTQAQLQRTLGALSTTSPTPDR